MVSDRPARLILASGSQTRIAMLRAAGLEFDVVPSQVDEAELYEAAIGEDEPVSPQALAALLARAKAIDVSLRHADAVVIGGDQVLALDGEIFHKAKDRDAARSTLAKLKGKTHSLFSAVTLAMDGCAVWTSVDRADLTMRDFSDAFLDQYIGRANEALTNSVGAYQIEGAGVTLFDRVEGQHTTILGLPLLPLLAELRRRDFLLR